MSQAKASIFTPWPLHPVGRRIRRVDFEAQIAPNDPRYTDFAINDVRSTDEFAIYQMLSDCRRINNDGLINVVIAFNQVV
jgi:hypothetical protein